MHSKNTRGATKAIFGMTAIFFVLATIGVVSVVLFDPFSDGDEGIEDLGRKGEARSGDGMIASIDGAPAENRVDLLPDGRGETVTVSGFVTLDGATLAGVTVQAFNDQSTALPATIRNRIETSPMYYSALGVQIRERLKKAGVDRLPSRTHSPPVAQCRSGRDGAFSLTFPAGKTVTFGLDHDFYYFPPAQAGPFRWTRDSDKPRLDLFAGRLEAEVGALVKGTISDSDGYPLEDVLVSLSSNAESFDFGFGGGFGGRGRDRDRAGPKETTSDDKGVFRLRGVAPDDGIALSASREGWAKAESKSFDPVAGQVHTVNLKLAEGASIKAIVHGPPGAPLRGAEVFLERSNDGGGNDRNGERDRGGRNRGGGFGRGMGDMFGMMDSTIEGAAKTGADGTIVFDALAPGKYTVRASRVGLLEAETRRPLTINDEVGVSEVELSLSEGVVIAGQVIDDASNPVVGALVEAVPHVESRGGRPEFGNMRRMMTTPESSEKKAETNASGFFRITGLSVDELFDLEAAAVGFTQGAESAVESGSQDVTIVVDRTGTITGRVISSAKSAAVSRFTVGIVPVRDDEGAMDFGRGGMGGDRGGRNERGRGGRGGPMGFGSDERGGDDSDPMSIMRDAMRETMRDSFRRGPRLTEREDEIHDSNGRFRLENIIPGTYRLCVSASRFAPAVTETIEVEKAETVSGLVISLAMGGSISGTVTSATGPVDKALVRLFGEEEAAGVEFTIALETVERDESDRNGVFRIDNLPAGTFVLEASHSNHPDGETGRIELAMGQAVTGIEITLPPAASITGVAYDAQGYPLADEAVLCGEGGSFRGSNRATTDDEGRFEFKGLGAGDYTVRLFSRANFGGRGRQSNRDEGSEAVDVSLEAGGVQQVVLRKNPLEGATVHGIITNNGVPVTGGFLTVSAQGRGDRRNAAINSDGTYSVEGVSPGLQQFSIRFTAEDTFENTTMQFEIPDMPQVLLDVALPGGRISGKVLDAATGALLEGARVSLIPEGEILGMDMGQGMGRGGRFGSRKSDTTDKNGYFSFHFLAAGTYRIEATAQRPEAGSGFAGYFPAELTDLVLDQDRSLDNVNVGLSTGGGIHLIVTNTNNEPVSGATITATKAGAGTQGGGRGGNRSRTDDSGNAWITGIEADTYRLTVQAQGMGQEAVDNIHVSAGRFEEIPLTLEIGYNISVRLKDANDQSVTDADIVLINSKGKTLSIPRGRGGRGNTTQLGVLAPGNYTIEATWGDTSGRASFKVESAGTQTLVVN